MAEAWSILYFAAGFGTRMGALTQNTPKPLLQVGGRPLLDHALDQTRGLDVGRQVVNGHYLADQISAAAAERSLIFSHERPVVLETGGGLRQAAPLLQNDTVMTMNTDAVWRGPPALRGLAAAWDPARMDALLLCVRAQNAVGHKGAGDFLMDADGALVRGPGVIYTGAQIIKQSCLQDAPDGPFSMNVIWSDLIEKNRLFGVLYDGKWCDVGRPEGLQLAEELLAVSDDA